MRALRRGALAATAVLVIGVCTCHGVQQYKTVARRMIALLSDGKIDQAIKRAREYLKKHPDDLESMYVLAIAYAQEGRDEQAMQYVRQAVENGLPFGRFVVGPRDIAAALRRLDGFQAFAEKRTPRLLSGPILGCVTDSSAKFWVRTAEQTTVNIRVRLQGQGVVIANGSAPSRRQEDYTAVIGVDGLEPNREYEYEVDIGGRQCGRWRFRTYPPRGKPAKFTVCFGGGAGYTPQHERIWRVIAGHRPAAFLFLGDNVYIDNPTRPAVQRYCYYRRQCRPEYRQLTASTPIYAIWDDHDFTTNDGWGGPEIDEPQWKIPVWEIFRQNWNNPYYGGGRRQPGCWFDFSIGDVDFFMLDCRYYRTNPRSSKPSMLGPVQKQWLLRKLLDSKATFKVVVSSVPWAFGTKPGSLDTWEGYKAEREEIFSFLEANRIEGVVLLSADRHRSDIWKIERPAGYDLYEFESSRLTNIHTHQSIKGALFSYNGKCSFGLLEFDTTGPDPQLTYKIINIDDELVHTFQLRKSRLSYR